jgi:hypothetical protein
MKRLNIAISSYWVGGIGGVERCVWSMVRSLEGHNIVVFANRVIQSELLPGSDECEIRTEFTPRPRYWRVKKHFAGIQRLIKTPPEGDFDLYLHLRHGVSLSHAISARKSILIAAGEAAPHLEDEFDFVSMEAPDGGRFITNTRKSLLLPPPVMAVVTTRSPIPVPPEFHLTVFNPYSDVKGLDVLEEVLDSTAIPIVWCYSERTLKLTRSLPDHPMLIKVADPTQANLEFLYESCVAYVSFSRSEGFGWAIADAFRTGKPVISRSVGVVTFFLDSPGLTIYDSVSALKDVLRQRTFDSRTGYDLAKIDARQFATAIANLV